MLMRDHVGLVTRKPQRLEGWNMNTPPSPTLGSRVAAGGVLVIEL